MDDDQCVDKKKGGDSRIEKRRCKVKKNCKDRKSMQAARTAEERREEQRRERGER